MGRRTFVAVLALGALLALGAALAACVPNREPPPAAAPTPLPATPVTPTPVTPTPASAGAASIQGLVWHDVCAVAGGEGGSPAVPSAGCVPAAGGGYRANGLLEPGEPGIAGVEVALGRGPARRPAWLAQ